MTKPSEIIETKYRENYARVLKLAEEATERKAPSLWLIANLQTDARVQAVIQYLDEQAKKEGCTCSQ